MTGRPRRRLLPICVLALACLGRPAAASETDVWASYLDYAYVYVSSEPDALRARLAAYAREAGMTLEEYVAEVLERPAPEGKGVDETGIRRRAIAWSSSLRSLR